MHYTTIFTDAEYFISLDLKSKAYFLAHPKILLQLKWSYLPILINYLRTDGQTNTVLIGKSLSTGRETCLSSIPGKNYLVPNGCQKRQPNRTETLIAVPGSTITFSWLNGKYNIHIFTQEKQVFEG